MDNFDLKKYLVEGKLNEEEAPQGDETVKDKKPVASGIAMISKDLEGQESAFKSINSKVKMEQFLDMIASKLDPKFKESSAFKQALLSFYRKNK
jgi:hypothetical protein